MEVLPGPNLVGDARCIVRVMGRFVRPQVQQVGMRILKKSMAYEGPRALILTLEVGRVVLRAARSNRANPTILRPALAILVDLS